MRLLALGRVLSLELGCLLTRSYLRRWLSGGGRRLLGHGRASPFCGCTDEPKIKQARQRITALDEP
jgi:hypothetical protein